MVKKIVNILLLEVPRYNDLLPQNFLAGVVMNLYVQVKSKTIRNKCA